MQVPYDLAGRRSVQQNMQQRERVTARLHDRRHRWLPAGLVPTWHAPVVCIQKVKGWEGTVMGRVRKTAWFFFSIGGYDGISPVAKESTRERLLREQNELIAKQTRLLEGTEVRREKPAREGVVRSASFLLLGSLSATSRTCIARRAWPYDCPPDDPSVLKGRCPKCSRPVVWYTERDESPVHAATGKFECLPDADSQGGRGVAAEIERLVALHSSGMLDDEEFRAAKARIIRSG